MLIISCAQPRVQVSSHVKEARVKVVMADLALTQLANRSVEALTTPEYRRLTIGVQLVRDPGEIFINPNQLILPATKSFSIFAQPRLCPFSQK
jgi:hypothetical protein